MKVLITINSRIMLCSLVLVCTVVAMSASASAQQAASQAIPSTQNPQVSGTVFPSQRNVQDTGNQQLLSGQRKIVIPRGKPLPATLSKTTESNQTVWIIGAVGTGIVTGLLLYILYVGRKSPASTKIQVSSDPSRPLEPAATPQLRKNSNPDKKRENAKAKRAKRKRKSRR